MNLMVRKYEPGDLRAMIQIWNQVVAAGNAFPQEEGLTPQSAAEFFAQQSCCGVAVRDGAVYGLYILHPNNVGRCGHIANASYAVAEDARGCGVGQKLVRDCMARARELGFRILQFNAVVASNMPAIRLYEKLGFVRLGTIPGGFRDGTGTYQDIIPFYHTL